MSATYRVSGMSCDGCAQAVMRAIGRRVPAAAVAVDVAAGRVTVTGEAAAAAVISAVAEAGFTVEGIAGPGA